MYNIGGEIGTLIVIKCWKVYGSGSANCIKMRIYYEKGHKINCLIKTVWYNTDIEQRWQN